MIKFIKKHFWFGLFVAVVFSWVFWVADTIINAEPTLSTSHYHAPTKIELPPHFHLEFMHRHSEFDHNHGAM